MVLAALLDPGRKLTNSLTAHPAVRIVQVSLPMVVPVPGVPVVQTTLCLSLGEGRTDIYLYMAYVLYQLVMFRFFIKSYRVNMSEWAGWREGAESTAPLRHLRQKASVQIPRQEQRLASF